MTDAELNTARTLAARIEAEAEPLEGDYAGYASVSIDDLRKLVEVLGPPTKRKYAICPNGTNTPIRLNDSKRTLCVFDSEIRAYKVLHRMPIAARNKLEIVSGELTIT